MISKMFDAANPPATPPPGCQVVMGYIGKLNFTPHIWTGGQWQPFAELRQIPCYVPDLANVPELEAGIAYRTAQALGWAAHEPDERAIVFDFETSEGPADRDWWQRCATEIAVAGFVAVMYGSLNTVFENAAEHIVVAAWDNDAQLLPGQTIHGHQYQAGIPWDGTEIDYSVIDEWLYDRAGRGARRLLRQTSEFSSLTDD